MDTINGTDRGEGQDEAGMGRAISGYKEGSRAPAGDG